MIKRGFSLLELLLVVAIIGILASLLLPVLSRAREAARRASCAGNMKQVALALKMYADEDRGGYYPPISHYQDENRLFSIHGAAMYPEYLTDVGVLVCLSDLDVTREDIVEKLNQIGNDASLSETQQQELIELVVSSSYSYAYISWAAINNDHFSSIFSGIGKMKSECGWIPECYADVLPLDPGVTDNRAHYFGIEPAVVQSGQTAVTLSIVYETV